jgi:transcriptional regulator with XRE-family HTH domain
MKTKKDTLSIANETARFFAQNLARLRDERHMSIKTASAKLGVAESTWSQWESGKRFPPCNLLDLVSQLFDVPPCVLLSNSSDGCTRPAHCGPSTTDRTADSSQNVNKHRSPFVPRTGSIPQEKKPMTQQRKGKEP